MSPQTEEFPILNVVKFLTKKGYFDFENLDFSALRYQEERLHSIMSSITKWRKAGKEVNLHKLRAAVYNYLEHVVDISCLLMPCFKPKDLENPPSSSEEEWNRCWEDVHYNLTRWANHFLTMDPSELTDPNKHWPTKRFGINSSLKRLIKELETGQMGAKHSVVCLHDVIVSCHDLVSFFLVVKTPIV